MLKYFLPLSRRSGWLLTLLLLGVLAIFSLAGPSLLQHVGTKHALLAYADQTGADALYLFPCDPGEFWQTMITLTNLENRKVEVDPFCYHRNGDFLGNSPFIESLKAEGTQTIKAEEIGVPGCQTFTLEADGKMVGALLLTSLDGEKSEAIPAMHKSAKQLDFPPLLEGDTEDKTITLLNPGFSSANLEVIALDPDGGQLEQTFLPPLSSRESRTFAVKDLFSPESLYQLSTVRVISDNSIVGLQLVDSTPGDLVGLPALTSTSHKWSFPILTMGGDVELWTTVGLFNPGEVLAFVTIEAFDAEDASLGIIETTAFFPGAIYDLYTANMEGIIPQETAVLKVTADEPIIGYAVIGAVEGRGVTATLGISAEDQMVAGVEIIGSSDGSVLEAFPMIMTKNGVLKSTAENLGEEELRQNIEIKTLGAPVQTLQKNKGATTDQESTAGFEETGAHVQDEDGEVFVGNSPPVPDSGATLSFKEDIVNEQEFSWTSSDPILGDIDTGGFVPATTWRLLGNNPTRLVFVGSGDGATFYGNVLFEPYNRAVVDVVKGGKRVRYLLKVAEVDLDVDTDMNGKIDDKDDKKEMKPRAIIIDVNNDSDAAGTQIDNQNNAIDGADDKNELTPLWLRKTIIPDGWKLVLKVSDKAKLRIFDDTDTGVIGPSAGGGGPNKDTHEVPKAKIIAGDLKYLIECFNHGNETVSLMLYDASSNEICRDEVNVVLNVDRKPGDVNKAVRFRINGGKNKNNLEGMETKIATPKAKVSYAPTIRMFASTNVWISIQKLDISRWIQSGLAVDRSVGGTPVEAIYFEVKYGGNPGDRYYVFKLTGGSPDPWPALGTFKVEITDFTTGKVVAFLDGTSWANLTSNWFKTGKLENYQIGSELFHSVDQHPGRASNKCVVSNAKVKISDAWQNTAYAAGDIKITDYDKNGNAIHPATSHEWAYSNVTATGWKMWDKVVEEP